VPAVGFDLVVLAVVRRTREVGHLVAHVTIVVTAVFHSDTTVPGLVYLSQLTDSMPPVPPHLASYCAAAFLILIGDSGALGAQDSTNPVVVAGSREDYSTQAGGRHGMMSVPGRMVVAVVTIVVVVAVKAQAHHRARESRLP